MTNEEFLKTRNTRELLKKTRVMNVPEDGIIEFHVMEKGGMAKGYYIDYDTVKAELETRPHVPNKNESRGLRLKRIKEGV